MGSLAEAGSSGLSRQKEVAVVLVRRQWGNSYVKLSCKSTRSDIYDQIIMNVQEVLSITVKLDVGKFP